MKDEAIFLQERVKCRADFLPGFSLNMSHVTGAEIIGEGSKVLVTVEDVHLEQSPQTTAPTWHLGTSVFSVTKATYHLKSHWTPLERLWQTPARPEGQPLLKSIEEILAGSDSGQTTEEETALWGWRRRPFVLNT